jgi:hypothetical protein
MLVAAGELDRQLWRMARSHEEQCQLYAHSEAARLELSGELASCREQLTVIRGELVYNQEQLTRCGVRLAVAESTTSTLMDVVAHKDEEVRELRGSRSWRVTQPMRWGGQLLRRLVSR